MLTLKSFKNSNATAFILFCIPVLLYLQTVFFGFTFFDDNSLILENAAYLGNLKNAGNLFLTDAFLHKTSAFYRPLQSISYMVDVLVAGKVSGAVFHFTNVILIGSISFSLFRLLEKLLVPLPLAAFGALLYCIHPLFVSSVAWIPARGDLLLTLFVVWSFIFLINYHSRGTAGQLIAHWIMFVMALFCKETAVVLPVLYAGYVQAFVGFRERKSAYIASAFVYAIAVTFWYVMRSNAIFSLQGEHAIIGFRALTANLRMIPEALALLLSPFSVAPVPAYSGFMTITGSILIALFALLVVTGKVALSKRSIFGVFWFLLLLLPSMLFKHHLIDYLNHRFLLPLIGILILALAEFPARWGDHENSAQKWLMLLVILLLSSTTFVKTMGYKDAMAFCNAALAGNQNSALMYNQRSVIRRLDNDLQGATDDCRKAISLNPEYEEAYYNCGTAKSQTGDYLGAVADFNRAILLNETYPDPHYARGLVYYNLREYGLAIEDFNSYISISKAAMVQINFNVYNDIGKSLTQLGKVEEAVNYFDKAVSSNPKHMQSYVNRAVARFYLKNYTGAVEDCDRALALKSDESVRQLKVRVLAAMNNGT